ncbi:UPF0057-domain-containing protein [Pluteus cervinus]|uniref:UPF0057-domain-containing protein n=1 Tax=Pluteus cervinus TaxID=181527 RepID=A0ACD3B390_9AGAR|nr:UPF0057-domain-containing protein [Pluteus cervinus]
MAMTIEDLLLYILAIFLPPLSVFVKRGFAPAFWINIILCLLLWIPAVLQAWYIIYTGKRTIFS